MRKFIAVVVATFALLIGVGVSPASAVKGDAGETSYVTRKEFRNVKKGMTSSKVHAIFDIKGQTFFQGYGYMDREYRTASKYGFVMISYKRKNGAWRLVSKSAYWG